MLGTSALAVSQVASVICEMLQSVYFGVGNATAMLIGETLGQGDKETAYLNGKKSGSHYLVPQFIMTIVMVILAKPVAGVYNFTGETNKLLVITLIAMAITITPKMLAYIYLVGILREAATRFSA